MKIRSVLVLMSATLVAAGVISASTATASHHPQSSSQRSPAFTLIAKQTSFSFLDLNKKGSQGDEIVFTEALFFKGQGQVGHDVGVCTLANKNASQCLVTANFNNVTKRVGPSTSLTVQGTVDQRHAHDALAVTGGTGGFEGTLGQVEVTSVSNTKTVLDFDLLPSVVNKVFK